MINEKEILRRLQAHDENAFRDVRQEYLEKMELFAFALLKDPFTANHVVGDLFERIWSGDELAKIELPIHNYLFSEVIIACREQHKRNKKLMQIS